MEENDFSGPSKASLETDAQYLQSEYDLVSKDNRLHINQSFSNLENIGFPNESSLSTWSIDSDFHKIVCQKQSINSIESKSQTTFLTLSSVQSFKESKEEMCFSQEFNDPDHCNDSYISLGVSPFFRFTSFQKENEVRRFLVYKNPSKIVKLRVAPRSFLKKSSHSFLVKNSGNFVKDIKLFDQDSVSAEKTPVNYVDSKSIHPFFLSKTLNNYVPISLINTKTSHRFNSKLFIVEAAPWPTVKNTHVKDYYNEIVVKDTPLFKGKKSNGKKESFFEDYYLGRYALLFDREKSILKKSFFYFSKLFYTLDDLKSVVSSVIPYDDLKRPCFNKIYKSLDDKFLSSDFYDVRLWISKYSPTRACEVLFSEYEVMKLRDWLMACKLGSNTIKISCVIASPKRHVLEKNQQICLNQLINYGTGSRNSTSFLDGINELRVLMNCQKKLYTKSQVSFARYILLTGPHGSYKSASVYAIAKELGFEIFEINSGSRRSGKDILNLVGEMSQSHLVNGEKVNNFNKSCFETKLDMSFRKQSLILIEEVDILYEQDKNFWGTVMNLVYKSKRPIIMTCTDINTIPSFFLEFQSIIYFNTAPVDLAANYLYLLSLSEGYIFSKEDLMHLYMSKGCDLRASILQLQFFTQISSNRSSELIQDIDMLVSDTSFKKIVFENMFLSSTEWSNDFCELLETEAFIGNRKHLDLIDDIFKNSLENIKLKDSFQIHGEIEKEKLFLDVHSDFLDTMSFCDYLSSKASFRCSVKELDLSNSDNLSSDTRHLDNLLGYDFLPSYRAYYTIYQSGYIYISLVIFIMSCFIFSNKLNDTDLDTLNICQYVSNAESLRVVLKGRYLVNMKELSIESLKVVFSPLLFSNIWNYDTIPNSINALSGFSLSVDIGPYVRDIIRSHKLYKKKKKKNTDDNDKRTTRSSSILDCNLRKLNKYNIKNEKAILDTWIE
ncbi:hypothetical protein PNEG_02044 [Pneumocystis murina B123]|uniref:ATPase AAA-type core domain-containing protein n=1 Tax=Pneumocystis murina (strain B123) TaxID=1069680 RepID=M7NMG6_PNEMU|nr:hypothetical protein PNEG_02044 [Pneumocystis murina B123]EMR09863.1 hypothetical protein PNEG_02044 [Pneumocystis murina B123]